MTTWYGNNLREMREKRGMTKQELSRRTGVNKETIRNLEDGRRGTSVTVLEKLLEPFECELDIMERNPG